MDRENHGSQAPRSAGAVLVIRGSLDPWRATRAAASIGVSRVFEPLSPPFVSVPPLLRVIPLPPSPPLARRLNFLLSRVCRKPCDCAARDLRPHAVGAAGQDDRHARAEHEARAVSVGQKTELLRQHVTGLEIGNEE